jgi:hypothetical protein
MQSAALEIFLSCSFQGKDAVIVNLVQAICQALDIKCINVSMGYAQTPGEKARDYIDKVPAMIAIATRRKRFRNGDYAMPSAVHEELSMAFGVKKPILLIHEDGVTIDGFLSNMGTYLTFSRDRIWNATFIEALVSSIHGLKMDVLPTARVGIYPQKEDHSTEMYQAFMELEKSNHGFVWTNSSKRKIKFGSDFRGPLKAGFWPDVFPSRHKTLRIEDWRIKYESGSQKFKLQTIVNRNRAALLDLSIHVKPQPRENDFIQYTLFCKSKFLFPIYLEDTNTAIVIKNRQYFAVAGVIRNTSTDVLKLIFKFPKEYRLDSHDISPVVATYSTTIDQIDEDEMKRMDASIDSFGETVLVNLVVSKPVPGRFYGIAWIPPRRSQSTVTTRRSKRA